MKYSFCTCCHCRSRSVSINSKPCRFTPYKLYIFVIDKFIEHSHRITSTTYTSHYDIRQSAFFFKYLRSGFTAYNTLKISYYSRERMWSHNRTENIESIINSVSPLSHTFVYGIFKSFCSCFNRMNFCSKKFHTIYVKCLTNCIFFTHVYFTFKVKKCCCCRCCDTVLTCTCLCNNSCLAHLLCKKCLAKYIVYLV